MASNATTEANFRLTGPGTLTGTVTNALTGQPIPGATVFVFDPLTGFFDSRTTDAAGRYTFASLRPARYQVDATAPGFQASSQTADVLAASTTTVDISLSP